LILKEEDDLEDERRSREKKMKMMSKLTNFNEIEEAI
jgi:hypothetical protein